MYRRAGAERWDSLDEMLVVDGSPKAKVLNVFGLDSFLSFLVLQVSLV